MTLPSSLHFMMQVRLTELAIYHRAQLIYLILSAAPRIKLTYTVEPSLAS